MKTAVQIRFLRKLNKLAKEADRFEMVLPNGGQVGSLLGSMADDLQLMWGIASFILAENSKDNG
jgi:hypothetical protein